MKKIYKLLSIEHEDTGKDRKEAEEALKMIEPMSGVELKDVGKVGGECKL